MEDLQGVEHLIGTLSPDKAAKMLAAVSTLVSAVKTQTGVDLPLSAAITNSFVKLAATGDTSGSLTVDDAIFEAKAMYADVFEGVTAQGPVEAAQPVETYEGFSPATRLALARSRQAPEVKERLVPTEEEVAKLSPADRLAFARGADLTARISAMRNGHTDRTSENLASANEKWNREAARRAGDLS